MTPEIKKTTVYVPTLVMEEMPSKGSLVSVSFDGGVSFSYEATGKGWKHNEVNYTHWLKPSEGYFFTPQDLLSLRRKWAGEAWDECWGETSDGWNGEIQPFNFMSYAENFNYTQTKQTYLNSLTID